MRAALDTDDKNVRDERLTPIYEEVHEHFAEDYPDRGRQDRRVPVPEPRNMWSAAGCWTSSKRVDGRGMDEMRPLAAEVGLLPRVHGSGMFTRGQTQVLTVATLGSIERRPAAGRH